MGAMIHESRVRPKDLAKRLGYSIPTLYRRIEQGIINRPHRDGGCAYWLESYVQDLMIPRQKEEEIGLNH